jgi:hypothetical protein
MGTLFDQRPRSEALTFGVVWEAARDMGLDPNKGLTPAEWHAACDVARTGLAAQNADIFDEQLAGFGELLKELVAAIEGLRGG